MAVLGIDTSCYTTSVALMEDGVLLSEYRIPLKVKEGQRGLRQSDGVFMHLGQLPECISELKKMSSVTIEAVCVSTAPRRAEGSYMPVFTVGHNYAKVISDTLEIPLIETTHQEGHIFAGIWSSQAHHLLSEPFLAVHLSGGTTEVLVIRSDGLRLSEEKAGGTLDLHAGQLIDRIGVKMGLSFPCGKAIEELAKQAGASIPLPTSVKEGNVNFSGIETKILSLIENGVDHHEISKALLDAVGRSLSKMLTYFSAQTGIRKVLVVGGVASNMLLRAQLMQKLPAIKWHFAKPGFSVDNAAGVAFHGERQFHQYKEGLLRWHKL